MSFQTRSIGFSSGLYVGRKAVRRWSIENAFQEEDRFQAKTKSPDIGLRFSLLFLGCVLRNLWLLLRKGWEELTTFLIRELLCQDVLSRLIGSSRRDRFRLRYKPAGG